MVRERCTEETVEVKNVGALLRGTGRKSGELKECKSEKEF